MKGIPSWVRPLLRCPVCRCELEGDVSLGCGTCGHWYGLTPVPLLVSDPSQLRPWMERMDEELLHRRCEMFRQMSWVGDEMMEGLGPGSLVLSVGEGHGEMALRLAERHPGVRFIASDVCPERVEWASSRARGLGVENVWFCVADANQLPLADACCVAGYARGVLHVIRDPAQAIAELRRVVRSRLLVDQLGNRPFFVLWFWLFQRYEYLRALAQRRAPNRRIWGEVAETLPRLGTYWPLVRYRRWFPGVRRARIRANCVFVWETGRHHPILGWFGYGGALEVRF